MGGCFAFVQTSDYMHVSALGKKGSMPTKIFPKRYCVRMYNDGYVFMLCLFLFLISVLFELLFFF